MKIPKILKSKILQIIFLGIMWTAIVFWFASNFKLQVPWEFHLRPLIVKREIVKNAHRTPIKEVKAQEVVVSPIPRSEEEIVKSVKHGEILWKIYQLETQRGKTDFCRLNKLGIGGFGVMDGSGIVCYQSFQEATDRASFWLNKLDPDNGLPEALCAWVSGKRGLIDCPYYRNYLSL